MVKATEGIQYKERRGCEKEEACFSRARGRHYGSVATVDKDGCRWLSNEGTWMVKSLKFKMFRGNDNVPGGREISRKKGSQHSFNERDRSEPSRSPLASKVCSPGSSRKESPSGNRTCENGAQEGGSKLL